MNRTGYCCINLTLDDSFKTMKLSWAERNSLADVATKWKTVVRHNIELLNKIIKWNISNNIFLYRISSDLIPFADHDKWGSLWRDSLENNWMKEETETVRQTLAMYLSVGGRVTIHPGQFVSISSPNKSTRDKSIDNLEYHGKLFDVLGLPQSFDCPINIHISNGTKGPAVVQHVEDSLARLSKSVKSRLVFENEQNGYWTPTNIKKHFSVPITLDYHHLLINPDNSDYELEDIVRFTSQTWPNNDPVQHWSEGRAHEKDPAHSDYITRLPDFPHDIEVEAKKKDLSIFPFLNTRNKEMTNVLY